MVTESVRKLLRAEGMRALRGAYDGADGGSKLACVGGAGRRAGSFGIWAGTGATMGKGSAGVLESKVKVREWSNIGRERQLGAANGDDHDGRREEFTGWKSSPVKEKIALRAARKVVVLTGKILEEGKSAKRRPTCNPDTWGTQLHLSDLGLGHASSQNPHA